MIHDISLPIYGGMIVYPGDPEVAMEKASSMEDGDSSNVSVLTMGTHTGTHVDPPRHMIMGGKTVDRLSLEALIGRCFVCDMRGRSYIDSNALEGAAINHYCGRVLFRTDNSDMWGDSVFHKDYTYLTPDGADWLVEKGIKLVGIDYLSVEQFHSGHHGAHLRLLNADVVIIEGIDLRSIEQGEYQLVCLPLRIKDGDGSPARAILIDI